MTEKEQLAQELMQAAEKDRGRPLTEKERAKLDEFTESFLLLLDDTEE